MTSIAKRHLGAALIAAFLAVAALPAAAPVADPKRCITPAGGAFLETETRALRSPLVSARFGAIDFEQFHTVDLPARLAAGNGALAAADLDGVQPIAFRIDDGRAYTYAPSADGITVTAGDDDAHTVVELTYADWCDFVWELRTCFALL